MLAFKCVSAGPECSKIDSGWGLVWKLGLTLLPKLLSWI